MEKERRGLSGGSRAEARGAEQSAEMGLDKMETRVCGEKVGRGLIKRRWTDEEMELHVE